MNDQSRIAKNADFQIIDKAIEGFSLEIAFRNVGIDIQTRLFN